MANRPTNDAFQNTLKPWPSFIYFFENHSLQLEFTTSVEIRYDIFFVTSYYSVCVVLRFALVLSITITYLQEKHHQI